MIMIKRSYFVRAKISHDNNTGLYSWWSGVMITESLTAMRGDDLFHAACELAKEKIIEFEGSKLIKSPVQIISLNRI